MTDPEGHSIPRCGSFFFRPPSHQSSLWPAHAVKNIVENFRALTRVCIFRKC